MPTGINQNIYISLGVVHGKEARHKLDSLNMSTDFQKKKSGKEATAGIGRDLKCVLPAEISASLTNAPIVLIDSPPK